MSIFYLDYVNGDDTKDGTSWANAWKTTVSGATAARIAPGDIIRIAKSPDPTSVGNGTWTPRPDTDYAAIPITSSTNASPIEITRASHGFVTGDIVSITAHTTNTSANGIWKVTRVDANKYTLDGSVGVGTGGASGTATKCNWQVVELATACTKNINRTGHEGAWTTAQGANIVVTADTAVSREGRYSTKLACAAGATTGKAAYFATGDLDLSAYQQISFYVYSTLVLDADDWKLCLCSDVAGADIVYTASFKVFPATNRWQTMVVDIGSAMSTTIKSVALYQNVDKGAFTLYVNNILACKSPASADSLTLDSLISPNSSAYGGTDEWYPIQSINGKIIKIADYKTDGISVRSGYYGTTDSAVTTYKRQPILTIPTSASGTVNGSTEAGSAGNLVEYQGGYNTSTSSQDGETWTCGQNSAGYGFLTNHNYIKTNRLSMCNYAIGMRISATGDYANVDNCHCHNGGGTGIMFVGAGDYCTIGTVSAMGNNGDGISVSADFSTLTSAKAYYNIGSGILVDGTDNVITAIPNSDGNSERGVYINGNNNYFISIGDLRKNAGNGILIGDVYQCKIDAISDLIYNGTYGINFSNSHNINITSINSISYNGDDAMSFVGVSNIFIYNCGTVQGNTGYAIFEGTGVSNNIRIANMVTADNTLGAIYFSRGPIFLNHCTLGEATEVTFNTTYLNDGNFVYSTAQDGDVDNHWQYRSNGTIRSTTAIRHTASGIAWQISPTDVSKNVNFPMRMSLTTFAVAANSEVTVTAYCKKSHATDIAANLIIKGGQIAGVPNDVSVTKASNTDWDEAGVNTPLSISFTPTEKGVVEVLGQAWWVANAADENVVFDDISITQA